MQVPAQVEYEKAASVSHALSLLSRYGPEARILAGGHSLIPMMKLRLARPEVLIDINGITNLRHITLSGSTIRIGALARHADLLSSEIIGEHFTILHDAERVIADPVVREWGTVGGSLCQADPSEDLSAAFAGLKGTMIITGQNGTREISARQFHVGPYETVVGPVEMLTEIRLSLRMPEGPPQPGRREAAAAVPSPVDGGPGQGPRQPGRRGDPGARRFVPGSPGRGGVRGVSPPEGGRRGGEAPLGGTAYVKVLRRAGDWPVGAAGVAVWLDGATSKAPLIRDAGIGLTALGARNFVAAEAEDFLCGKAATEENLTRAGEIAAANCRPVADQRGPEDYKRHLAGELTTRALRIAVRRALGGQ